MRLKEAATASGYLAAFLADFHRYAIERINGARIMTLEDTDNYFTPDAVSTTADYLMNFEAIRNAMIGRFQVELQSQFQEKSPGDNWKSRLVDQCDIDVQNFDKRYCGLHFSKSSWRNRYEIGFQNQEPCGTYMWFGIRDKKHDDLSRPNDLANLVTSLSKMLETVGESNQHWVWGAYLKSSRKREYADWGSPRVIEAMTMLDKMADNLFLALALMVQVVGGRLDIAA